ncbi:MAG TPA: ATP-binding protein [Sandaracinaceae bacterium LLY-WYZ-13_1]|nr:ATP-binding protein [Sandaracinaceae bacterium LLY-WYZ-13_1]
MTADGELAEADATVRALLESPEARARLAAFAGRVPADGETHDEVLELGPAEGPRRVRIAGARVDEGARIEAVWVEAPERGGFRPESTERLGALQQREGDLQRILERSPDAMVLHREGQVVWANARAVGLFELDEDPVGRPMPPALLAGDDAAPAGALREVRFPRSDGSQRVMEVARLAVLFEGHQTGLLVARDLTERRTLQAKMAQADRLATVGTLAASVAHEVNNPLTYLIHYVARLQRRLGEIVDTVERLDAPEAREVVDELRALEDGAVAAEDGVSRVRDIVRDLKTFSRVEDGPTVPIDLNQSLRSAIQMASHQVRGRARLRVELGALPAVRAHDGRLCQVFLNLVLNAGQAIEQGSAVEEPEIRVQSWFDGVDVRVAVSDTGCGIDGHHLSRLFEPFFSTKPGRLGSGLGLWISREIVHELGGHIEVESAPDQGSTFTVVIPAGVGVAAESMSSAPPPPRTLPPRLSPGRRVLVVDDEPALRELLAEALAERAQVVTASNGADARELLEHDDRFDAILCDLMMPGMNGVELYRWVSDSRPALTERIVFMSGAAYTPETRALLGRLPNTRLDKPFRVRDVERVLDRLIGGA